MELLHSGISLLLGTLMRQHTIEVIFLDYYD